MAHDRARQAGPEALVDVVRPRGRHRQPHAHAGTRPPEPGGCRGPYSESNAGWSVAAASTETTGIRKPPIPIARTNGSGMNIRSASPIATVAPENITARPAVAIVRTIALVLRALCSSSSRKR